MTSTLTPASQAMRTTRPRTGWDELPYIVCAAVESVTGAVRAVEPISAGLNCGIAALLHTPTGSVFIKGLPSDHPRVAAQRREAEINPHVVPIAPRLLGHIESADGTSWSSSTSTPGMPTSHPTPPTYPRSPSS